VGKLSRIPTDDLIRELRNRQENTYMEDTEWLRSTRGRGHSSKASLLLLELEIGDVKRIYHNDIFCHQAPHNKCYYCGLSRTRDRLRKEGKIFNIYHEKEHVAVVARVA